MRRVPLFALGLAVLGGAVLAATGAPGLDRRIPNQDAFLTEVDGGGATYKLERVFSKLTFNEPVYLTHANDGTRRIYVVERGGIVWSINPVADPTKDKATRHKFLDISSRVQSQQGNELGLLSIAFAPDFASSRTVYAFYSTGQDFSPQLGPKTVKNRVSRFKAKKAAPTTTTPRSVGLTGALDRVDHDGDRDGWFERFFEGIWGGIRGVFSAIAHIFSHPKKPAPAPAEFALDPASEEILLEIPKAYFNHNGGQLQFGPDGMLYVSVGDGGSQGDPERNGQNLRSLKAKILRIDPSQGPKYAVPADNPFVGVARARGEIWAYGFRNPWRFSFDRASGDLWLGCVGQETLLVDVVKKGGNYGWSVMDGSQPYNPGPRQGVLKPDLELPKHDDTGGVCIGGYVYRGTRLPGLQGAYVFGDYNSGNVFALRWDGSKVTGHERLLQRADLQLTSFGEDESGELYLCSDAGPIYRLAQASAASSHFPRKLSETKLFSDVASLKMRPELIPYGVAEPLWSDGAEKHRWMAIPHLDQVVRTDEGGFRFPADSVLVKHFLLGGKKVETRLMVHAGGQWTGYSYEWNDQGTDGDLLAEGKTKRVNGQEWVFPSRSDCFRCHSQANGTLLGPQTPELNSVFDYSIAGGRAANQLETLAHLGVFTQALPDTSTLPRLVSHDDTHATLEARARSYLHVNCSICHRPGGTAAANIDLRFDTPLARMGIVDATPQEGDLGVAGARIVAPGEPEKSVLYLRMSRRGAKQMPPLATSLVDQDGSKVVADWIRSLH